LQENYLRWIRWRVLRARREPRALEHHVQARQGQAAEHTLDAATGKFLENDKSPSRKVAASTTGQPLYLCYTGPRAGGAEQRSELKAFLAIAAELEKNEPSSSRLIDVQASPSTSAATTSRIRHSLRRLPEQDANHPRKL